MWSEWKFDCIDVVDQHFCHHIMWFLIKLSTQSWYAVQKAVSFLMDEHEHGGFASVFFLFIFIWPLNVVCCVRSQYVYFVLVVHQYERHNHPPIGLIWGVFFSFSFCTTFFRRTQKTQSAFVHGDFSGRYVLCIFVMRTSKIHGRICIYYYCYTFDSKWWICFVFVSFFRCCLLMLTTSSRISTPTHQNYTYYLSISHRAIVFRAYNI